MNKEKFGIVVNPASGRKDGTKFARKLAVELNNTPVNTLQEFENGQIPIIPENLIVIGGDGTKRAVYTRLVESGERPQVLIGGFGSANNFRQMLLDRGSSLTIAEVKKDDIPATTFLPFRPGIIQGEESLYPFVSVAGFGRFERILGAELEKVRSVKIKPKDRVYLASLSSVLYTLATANSASIDDPILRIYATSPKFADVKIDSKLKQKDEELVSIEASGNNHHAAVIKLLTAILFWQAGLRAPKSLVRVSYSSEFEINLGNRNCKRYANLDGDLRLVEGKTVKIGRTKDSIPTAALIWENKLY